MIPSGLSHSETMTVAACHTVPKVADWPGFADMPPVLATAMMIGFVEQTCIQALRPHLAPGQHSVGTMVEITHIAATPVGMDVTATVALIAAEGRSLTFRVTCHDAAGLIGEGIHKRALIDQARFMDRVRDKAALIGGARA